MESKLYSKLPNTNNSTAISDEDCTKCNKQELEQIAKFLYEMYLKEKHRQRQYS